ncbi:glycosyltransferase [Tomitella fengzijianii]|uniref:Glycosyltransferase n=1 Tax=Tomitella fengzijianii TaxID=2597660 RepID=A0A516X069_9ACTN|nr:glycosyltransferase [Tomitella fengzijianii]QDQ96475.1 glycosyltransferase [Tomitella fengzijianii]
MTETPIELSVVLPVYAGADPAHFRRALESLYAQTYPAAEVIIVEDGPLHPGHHEVLDEFAGRTPVPRRIVLPENRGAAAGNQAGLEAARFAWIAKADSDDVNLPARFAVQVEAIQQAERDGRPLDCVGSAMFEFDGGPAGEEADHVVGLRSLPCAPRALSRYARRNSPLNHPTVLYRRDLARSVGGYRHVPYMEDYDLFGRMLAAGARMANLPEPLVLFRAGDAMLGRRRAPGIFAAERTMQRNLRAYGLVGPIESRINLAARTAFRMLPAPLLRRAYRGLFHKHPR